MAYRHFGAMVKKGDDATAREGINEHSCLWGVIQRGDEEVTHGYCLEKKKERNSKPVASGMLVVISLGSSLSQNSELLFFLWLDGFSMNLDTSALVDVTKRGAGIRG